MIHDYCLVREYTYIYIYTYSYIYIYILIYLFSLQFRPIIGEFACDIHKWDIEMIWFVAIFRTSDMHNAYCVRIGFLIWSEIVLIDFSQRSITLFVIFVCQRNVGSCIIHHDAIIVSEDDYGINMIFWVSYCFDMWMKLKSTNLRKCLFIIHNVEEDGHPQIIFLIFLILLQSNLI